MTESLTTDQCHECARWKARAEEAEGILSHNMALANATTRRAMNERNDIIRKLRERHSAAEIADMAGLTRQRVYQILNEAPAESAADVAAEPSTNTTSAAAEVAGVKEVERSTGPYTADNGRSNSVAAVDHSSAPGRQCPLCLRALDSDWPFAHCGRSDCDSIRERLAS